MEALAGWDPFSEEKPESVDWAVVNEILQGASTKARYKKNSSDVITQTTAGNNTFNGVRTATLFGLGNYAKTILIPSLPKGISISRIHEIDPLQITGDKSYEWDTSPVLSSNDNNDIVFIAGYHHTHNELACSAITAGKFAVVEKPLVVNRHQLATLEKAFDVGNGSYFACFHKRYSLFNEDALSDLRAEAYQTAINYHCIVYEVPLPAKHWYRWKSSSSRIISNGCHWIDHFIYLNDFSKPIRIQCSEASNGTISVFMELENGACFTMTLTDVGSEKIGVQDHIELRCNDVTVKITNGSRYIAESKDRTLRKKKINKIASYRNMYASISRSILSNIPGDSWEHTKISSEAILSVNEMLGGRQ
jgi:predicted dehydrogenase